MLRQPIGYQLLLLQLVKISALGVCLFFPPIWQETAFFVLRYYKRASIHSLAPDVLCTNGTCLPEVRMIWCLVTMPVLPIKSALTDWHWRTETWLSLVSQMFSRCLERAREMNKSNRFILRQENQGEDSKYWTNETLVLSERIKKEREMSKTGHGTHPGWRRTWNLNQWGKTTKHDLN